nr:nucleotidyl transferase AbiEii/AbiGii toxin family protein [Bordetella sp. LUAb4]
MFVKAAAGMGTTTENVEKDFWVCWTLDALFNGLKRSGPRLLFKGGTSLSKAYGLISRFSEDIDITVFREDIGQPLVAADLEALSGKQRRVRLDCIRQACQRYVAGAMCRELREVAARAIRSDRFHLELDPEDPDQQTLLFWYPTVVAKSNPYIRSAVKIEAGAKSALDPHETASVVPYVDNYLPSLDMTVSNITTVSPERTFWDKIMILHGLCQWHGRRGELRHGGQRVSRHSYDVYRLLRHPSAAAWISDNHLAQDCARHARLFFGSPDQGLDTARHGSFTLSPSIAMRDALARDYEAMGTMIFGPLPDLADVLGSIRDLEGRLNSL